MYIATKASRIRQREAERARRNRAEIVKARSLGQISRRDLVKWGIFTAGGLLVCKNGLSPFARSAFAAIPTGTPLSPLFGAQKFTSPLPRLQLQTPVPMTALARGAEVDAAFGGQFANERPARRLSYHNDFSEFVGDPADNPFRNPITNRGPLEGRPPTEFTLTAITADRATFENPSHDFPKVIRYTRQPDGTLEAHVSDGAQRAETFVFRRPE